MPQIYDTRPTALLPLRRKACWWFFRPKNPTASAGFEPANLGTKGQHATPRPPKPHCLNITKNKLVCTSICNWHYLPASVLNSNEYIGTETRIFWKEVEEMKMYWYNVPCSWTSVLSFQETTLWSLTSITYRTQISQTGDRLNCKR